jgi:hypothetical protein
MLVVAGVVRAAQAGGVQADEVVEGVPAGRPLAEQAGGGELVEERPGLRLRDGAVVQGQPPEQAARGKAELPAGCGAAARHMTSAPSRNNPRRPPPRPVSTSG